MTYEQLEFAQLAVPKREHCTFAGWYADRYLTTRVADERGNIVLDNELFDSDCEKFYAKWIAENTHQYKILMVYVTELNAELRTTDKQNTIQVNYKMSETERKICEMLTKKISFELNDLAVADFVVDEYFTTVPLTKENVSEDYERGDHIDNAIWAYDIPEVHDKLTDYDSVLTSFSMDDYFNDLHTDGGAAQAKYGHIHFDGEFTQLIYYGEPFESLFDPSHYYWDSFIDTYLHELAHTIEQKVNGLFEFHEVVREYLWATVKDPCIVTKLYFTNKAVVNEETVGIPYGFWEGKVARVHYDAINIDDGVYNSDSIPWGYVRRTEGYHGLVHEDRHPNYLNISDEIQYVIYGQYAFEVEASIFPDRDYEFVGWSDGVTTANRKDFITGDLHVYAIFRKIK